MATICTNQIHLTQFCARNVVEERCSKNQQQSSHVHCVEIITTSDLLIKMSNLWSFGLGQFENRSSIADDQQLLRSSPACKFHNIPCTNLVKIDSMIKVSNLCSVGFTQSGTCSAVWPVLDECAWCVVVCGSAAERMNWELEVVGSIQG